LYAARLILSQVSQAYGLMILGEGLFQADGHPGNILVQRGGSNTQLKRSARASFDMLLQAARLILCQVSQATCQTIKCCHCIVAAPYRLLS
jgi:predicted unusual protein kinase regulating ubiquinone biosynthesis (AarF/ABC1/UbiB family)